MDTTNLKEIIMGFNILDKDNNHVGWTATKFDNDSGLTFISDDSPLPDTTVDLKSLKNAKINAIKTKYK